MIVPSKSSNRLRKTVKIVNCSPSESMEVLADLDLDFWDLESLTCEVDMSRKYIKIRKGIKGISSE